MNVLTKSSKSRAVLATGAIHFLHLSVVTRAITFREKEAKFKFFRILLNSVSPNALDERKNTPLHLTRDIPTGRQLIEVEAVANLRNAEEKLPHEVIATQDPRDLILEEWIQLVQIDEQSPI